MNGDDDIIVGGPESQTDVNLRAMGLEGAPKSWGEPVQTSQEQAEDTYLVTETVYNIGTLFGGGDTDELEFYMCLDPGDEILDFGVCFTESSLQSPFLQAGNNLTDLRDAVAARGPLGVSEVSPVPVEGESAIATTTATKKLMVDATSGAVTVSLYHSATYGAQEITVKKTDSGGNAVTIQADAGNFIDGATSVTLSNQYDFVTLAPGTYNWWVVATNF